jgi:hypothetical protein
MDSPGHLSDNGSAGGGGEKRSSGTSASGNRLSAKWQQCGSNRAQDTAEPIRMDGEVEVTFWLI